ncbi:hypothetical protein RJ640_002194 [Escallonia rubra]|uniref:RNase H type-1 domain-containing protein n=1 Tax=Escallonia rubra TaxID=112253 RepID=A0AA88RTN2_9ASTE|nr:hypothetical protein RJ640_002194 [Escallonia rubra]
MENDSKRAAARSSSSSTSTCPVTRSKARDEMVAPNQVVVPISKPRVQFKEVVVSHYEKDGVSGSKVPHLELEENTLHEMPPPSFQYASDEKCFILNELIMNLAKKGKIELDIDGVEESNHASVISSDVTPSKGPNTSNNTLTMGAHMMIIQFGTLDPGKRHAAKRSHKEVDKASRLDIPKPITLGDFFPSGYLKDEVVETVCMVSVHEDEHDLDAEAIGEDNESMLTSLQGLPLRFTLQEMLDLPEPAHKLKSDTLFHVIDAMKSYNLFLRRPWAHENGVVPSILHQCLKFYRDREKKVDGDGRPFTEAEFHFADAKFYMESEMSQECLSTETSSTKKNEPQKGKQVMMPSQLQPKEVLKGSVSGEKKPPLKEVQKESPRKESPVFKYVPVSRKAEGQSPFVDLAELKEVKAARVPKKVDVQVLKEELTVPLTTIGTVRLPLKGFVEPSRDMAKHPHPPSVKTYKGFDVKAQRLLKSSGYDFENPVSLGELSPELTGEKVHGLNKMQKKLRQQGHRVSPPRMGVGYKPGRPIRVPLKSKQNKVRIKYITAEEVDESGDGQTVLPRTSVFDYIQTLTTTSLKQIKTSSSEHSSQTSAFKRLGVTPLNKSKIDSTRIPRASVFSRLGGPACKIDDKDFGSTSEIEAGPKEDRKTRSLILSRMKRKTKIEVINDGILKAKRRTTVITGQGNNQVEKKSRNNEDVVEAVYHITTEENATLDTVEDDLMEADASPARKRGITYFDIVYVPRTAIKGQALADFLVDHPIPADWKISEDFPDEEVFFVETFQPCMMFFDEAARLDGAGARVAFVSPQRQVLSYTFTLGEKCSNNVVEYQALIIGLQMALELGIPSLAVSGDSKLVINQLLKEYEVKKEDLVLYFRYATSLINKFDSVELEHADAISVRVVEAEDWRQPLIDYLEHGRLTEDIRHKVEIQRREPRFIHYKDTLFRRSYEGLFLRCLGEDEAAQAMDKAHSGVCGAHNQVRSFTSESRGCVTTCRLWSRTA